MASSPTEIATHGFTGQGGTELAWHETGPRNGRALVLIHGLFSDAATNWIKFGHAARLAAAGHRVIMPDLRAHGASARPHDPAAYPPDVLAIDGEALLERMGLAPGSYDLAGYSLGGRTALRMMVRGARPRRAVLAGMGLEGLLNTGKRAGHFRHVLEGLGAHPRGSPAFMAEAFLKTTGGDPAALLPLLGSFVDTTREELAAIRTPSLVVAGSDDHDNGSAEELAAALGDGRYQAIPGNHMSAVVHQQLGEAMISYLA